MLTYDELAQQDDYRVLRGARAAMLSYVINVPGTIPSAQPTANKIWYTVSALQHLR